MEEGRDIESDCTVTSFQRIEQDAIGYYACTFTLNDVCAEKMQKLNMVYLYIMCFFYISWL